MGQITNRFARIRSLLMIDPAIVGKANAAQSASADALVIDLAALAVIGRSVRVARREATAAFITGMRSRAYRPLLLIRIASLDVATTDGDIEAVMPSRPDGIILSGCPGGEAVQRLGIRLGVLEAVHNQPHSGTSIIAEAGASAAGLMALQSLRDASPRLAALTWDAAALADDIGGAPSVFSEDETARGVARTLLALGARAANVPAFDTVVALQGEKLARECAGAKRLGFCGKIAGDAGQVAVINTVFAQATPQAHAQPM